MLEKVDGLTHYRKWNQKDHFELDIIDEELYKLENNIWAKLQNTILKFIFSEEIKKGDEKWNGELSELADNPTFRDFQKRLAGYSALIINHTGYLSFDNYLESLLLVDQISLALEDNSISFGKGINALDVGVGKGWSYAKPLHCFLRNYDTEVPRHVNLHGIDVRASKKDIARFQKGLNGSQQIYFENQDVLTMEDTNKYDLILINNMLTKPIHFKKFGVKTMNTDDLMSKCLELLAPKGVQITIGPHCAGEYWNIVEHIPLSKRVAEYQYKVELGNTDLNWRLTRGYDRIYKSGVCVSRK